MLETVVKIINVRGLHARAATRLIEVVEQFSAEVEIGIDASGILVSGRNIMQVLSLAASKGTALRIRVCGRDEQQAIEALRTLINNRFEEDE